MFKARTVTLVRPRETDFMQYERWQEKLNNFFPVWAETKFKADLSCEGNPLFYSSYDEFTFLYKTLNEYYPLYDAWIVMGYLVLQGWQGFYDFNRLVYSVLDSPPACFPWKGTTWAVSHELEHFFIDKLKLSGTLHEKVHENDRSGLKDFWDADFQPADSASKAEFITVGGNYL